jgi:hypothetical protein
VVCAFNRNPSVGRGGGQSEGEGPSVGEESSSVGESIGGTWSSSYAEHMGVYQSKQYTLTLWTFVSVMYGTCAPILYRNVLPLYDVLLVCWRKSSAALGER